MTILGVLFVTGMAFLAAMGFEAEMIQAERQQARFRPGVEDVFEDLDSLLSESLLPKLDESLADAVLGSPRSSFAELPGVHNLFSPIEPYRKRDERDEYHYYYRWFTDVRALSGEASTELDVDRSEILADEWFNGIPPKVDDPDFMPVDADGDGIVDSIQVDLEDIGIDTAQVAGLAQAVNPASRSAGKVYLGLRVIAHGGMVNLNDSPRVMVENLFGFNHLYRYDQRVGVPRTESGGPPYDPRIEEGPLRRRSFLPPRELPVTLLQGNTLLGTDYEAGNGDLPLFPADSTLAFRSGQTLQADEHRYWPYSPMERTIAEEKPDWAVRMDPVSAYYVPDRYDRRHLVTTISHDDLLARPTWFAVLDDGGDLQAVNPATWVIEQFEFEASARFPYVDYPDRLPAAGPPDPDADPLKGKLRLSLAWLDKRFNINDPADKVEMIPLIQDVFTLMLLNARGPAWGSFQADADGDGVFDYPKDDDGDGLIDRYGRVWQHDYPTISWTAASLTANLIDFADSSFIVDDEPTAVELREPNPASPDFGLGTGEYVFGLERQPFITEVVARAATFLVGDNAGQLDLSTSFFGVELFNPYDTAIELGSGLGEIYSLEVDGVRIPLDYTLPARSFVGFYSGAIAGTLGKNHGGITEPLMSQLEFDEGSTIHLVRTLSGGTTIRVDRFDLSGTGGDVGTLGGPLRSIERYADSGAYRWTAPIPDQLLRRKGESFGRPNLPDTNRVPVEVELADSGSLQTAFPTTGSLLLLMRYANSMDEPFTVFLPDEGDAVDNGRMPVFDEAMIHHVDPRIDPSFEPQELTLERAGELMHLPWGQLVFDYFTALPLSNGGPNDSDFLDNDPDLPRVDQDGLRVHGRINLNAAPWSVLMGVPLVHPKEFPDPFRERFRSRLEAAMLQPLTGEEPSLFLLPLDHPEKPAKAIVAYREAREIMTETDGGTSSTGDYGDGLGIDGWRGWEHDSPKARRGMGFMSVGELANIRHNRATDELYRFDLGETDLSGARYIDAVAMLAMLSDWVTVRSHVFTVYGTLRGDVDETIEDEDADVQKALRSADVSLRALRFQETVDRLPALSGEEPDRIGGRVVAKYNDTRSD